MRWAIGGATIERSSASCATPQAGKPPLRYMGRSTYPSASFGAIRIGLCQASGSMTRDFYEPQQLQPLKTEVTSYRSTSLVRYLTRSRLLLQGYNTTREASVSRMRVLVDGESHGNTFEPSTSSVRTFPFQRCRVDMC